MFHTDNLLPATKKAAEKAESGELNCVNQSLDEQVYVKPKYYTNLGDPEGKEEWQRNPLGILPRTTKSGSVTHFLNLAKHFVDSLPKAVKGKPVLLILDGHASRWSISAIRYLLSNNVFVFYLMGHSFIWRQPNNCGANQRFHACIEKIAKEFRRGDGTDKGTVGYMNALFAKA